MCITAHVGNSGLFHFLRTLPAIDVALLGAAHCQGVGRHISGDGRTGSGGGAVADPVFLFHILGRIGDQADIDLSASTQQGNGRTLSASIRGGGTLTPYGAALHRTNTVGGTRLMLDTGGVPDVPVRGYGVSTRTNAFGKAVISDISSYQRTAASVDLESLPSNVEATQSVTQLTLTDGAIGYRSLEVIAGEKAMAVLRLPDGSSPPFGATVKNIKQQDTGIVNDGGAVTRAASRPASR